MRNFAIALIGAANAINLEDLEFLAYVSKYNKSYATLEEYNYR